MNILQERSLVFQIAVCMSNVPDLYSTKCAGRNGLQSSTAVIEQDGRITVTCAFSAGASSTGCQVAILMMNGLQVLLARNITRTKTVNEVITLKHWQNECWYNEY